MAKLTLLKGIASPLHKPPSHRSTHNRNNKRQHAWIDVDDDGLEVKSAKRPSSASKNGPQSEHGPRKKPRPSAPPSFVSRNDSIRFHRTQLPIYAGKDAVIDVVRQNDVTVLIGETGSGKTTQVPQYLLEAGLARSGMIAVTQPRKVAATSLATRVATEQQSFVGQLVGYSVRFNEASSSQTRIKYLTDGMIVRELLGDPLLSRYSVVIVDEAHERTLRTDILIANLKTILETRNRPSPGATDKGKGKATESSDKLNPLKVIIMSATLEADKFSSFFNNAKVVYVKGRQHPVTTYFTTTSQPDYVDAALRTFFQVHLDQPEGDVLIFLPGQEDIESLDKSIELYKKQLPPEVPGVLILPLYASLPPAQQAKIFSPTPKGLRKVVLATNIAETSITIPGVKYVIDTGKCKEKRFVARHMGTGFDTLLTRDITQSAAVQRAGRAGREGKGYCFRLYTEESYKKMPAMAEPEIRRCTLTSSLLQLKCQNQDIEELDFMDKPDADSIASALKALFLLGAIDNIKALTPLGRQMAAFPLEPSLARAVLAAAELGCTAEMLTIVSVLSAGSKLFVDTHDAGGRDEAAEARRKFRHALGDHLTVLAAFKAFEEVEGSESKKGQKDWCRRMWVNEKCLHEAGSIRVQLREVCERAGLDWKVSAEAQGGQGWETAVLKALVRGLVQNSAVLQPDGSYKQVMGSSVVKIHPSSSLADKKVPAIVYDELVYTTHIYARGVSAIPRSYIAEVPVFKHRMG